MDAKRPKSLVFIHTRILINLFGGGGFVDSCSENFSVFWGNSAYKIVLNVLNGIGSVITRNHPCKDGNAGFITVTLKALLAQV